MSISLDKHWVEHYNMHKPDKNDPFRRAMEQREIKIRGIKSKHKTDCPKDCRYIAEDVLLQLKVCWDCENNDRFQLSLKNIINKTTNQVFK